MALSGFLDIIDGRSVQGWAYDDVGCCSPRVVLSVNGRTIDETVGTAFRPDLLAAGIGDGHHGFQFVLPDGYESDAMTVVVRFAESGVALAFGERLMAGGELAKSELFGGVLADGIWAPDEIADDHETTLLAGWGVPPGGLPLPFTVLQDGEPPLTIDYVERPDIAQLLGLPAGNAQYGFRCTFPLDDFAHRTYTFARADTNVPFAPNRDVHVLSQAGALPEDFRRRRVGGTDILASFQMVGSTAFARLDHVLRTRFQRSIAESTAILDWGCGCGRVFRYLPRHRLGALTGVDIDRDNVSWCREHFPEASFGVVPLRPPSSLPSATYDVVFGISVMTHLTEENHLEWLAELHRVTAPGAAVVLSIHGETAWLTGSLSLDAYAPWRRHGFSVVGKNYDLEGSGADGSSYYNSFISRRYVFERWSAYFQVLDVIPGALFNQDLVVMRR